MNPISSNASVTSVSSISGSGTGTYSQAYRSLLAKYRPKSLKDGLSSLSLKKNFERHLKEVNIADIKHHASGPNSLVYLGTQTTTGRPMVVKVLLKTPIEEAGGSVVKRFAEHGNVPGIASVQCASINERCFSLVSEYYPLGSLASHLAENGPLKESDARPIFQGAFQGLTYLHRQKTSHRNLKLENILLDGAKGAVLSDYTFSLMAPNSANLVAVISTGLPFLAPEQFTEKPYNRIIADVFSFGVCLFIALNDFPPFGLSASNSLAEADSLLFNEGVQVSGQVKSCIQEMLQCDVNKRISSLALESHPWFAK